MTDIEAIRIEMLNEAATAAKALFNTKGTDHWGACGFAWTTYLSRA